MGHALTFLAGGLWLTMMSIGSLTLMFSYARTGNTHGVVSSTLWFITVMALLGIYLQWLGV
jgi:hypothetical protein